MKRTQDDLHELERMLAGTEKADMGARALRLGGRRWGL